MNNVRRKQINNLVARLEILKSDIESVLMDEEMCFDSLSENLQSSPNGEVMQEAIENLQNAVDSMDEAIDSLTEASM